VKARMPTSTAGTRNPVARGAQSLDPVRFGRSGFTLLELTLVLLIISVMLALTVPRLRDPGRAEMESHAGRLMQTFRLLRSEAVLNGYAYRLMYDLDQQRYWVMPDEGSVDLAEFAEEMGSLARGTQIHEPVAMADVVLPTMAGKVAQGQIYTVFYPDGTVDPTVIHLTNGRSACTLYVNPMNDRLMRADGYQDVNFSG
jgi:type II secretion system protein H